MSEVGVVDSHHQFMRACTSCGAPRMHVQRKPDHFRHLLLTVLTIGFWIPVWLLVGIFQARPKCMTCGEKPGLLSVG